MTDAELRDAAVAELRLTTRGLKGYTPPPSSHWAKALDYLGQIDGASEYRWPEPQLSAPVLFELASATHAGMRGGAGRDLRVHQVEPVIGGGSTWLPIEGWRNVLWNGGTVTLTATNATGIVPRECSGVVDLRNLRLGGAGLMDAIAARWRVAILQVQGTRIEVHSQGAPPNNSHADCFQTQEAMMDELRVDSCTFVTDYQGVFVSNEVSTKPGTDPQTACYVGHTFLSRLNFHPRAGVSPASWLFKAIPSRTAVVPGAWDLEDVWLPDARVYPGPSFRDWLGNDATFGAFEEADVQGQYVRWSTPTDRVPRGAFMGQPCGDCGIRGVARIGQPPGGDFAP